MKWIWDRYGWPVIVYGSLGLLLLLFLYNWWEGSRNASSNTTWTHIWHKVKQLFQPSSFHPPTVEVGGRGPPIVSERSSSPPVSSKGEEQCRSFLEFYFHKKFERVRPTFLTNPITQQCLELDCYNEELRLAVEYNGAQHYKFNAMMHQQSKHAFQNQQYRDYIKKQLCEEQGIRLIIVPYTVSVENIPSFLYHELKKQGFSPSST